ncbi:MAG: hypothetical protein ABWX61_10430 [Paenisporosarcina sp.]
MKTTVDRTAGYFENQLHYTSIQEERNSSNMKGSPEHLIRMELHMAQMIRIIANLNERLLLLERQLQEPVLTIQKDR